MKITDEMVDRAARVICNGLPADTYRGSQTLAARLARGVCWAPDCPCWDQGREVTRAALEAALEQKP